MMQRYIAFAWNQQKTEQTSLAKTLVHRLKSKLPEWKCVLAASGLQVYHVGATAPSSQAYLLQRNAGAIVGKVFDRRTDTGRVQHDVTFDNEETRKIQETNGRHLVENYWGSYVALLREDCGVRVRILRDPTGALPCLITKFRGIDVVCSHIDDCATLGLIDCTIDWDHIAAYLWHSRLVTSHTGLESVRQIQAGECMTIGDDGNTATFYWTPDRIYDARVVEDRRQAMRELREVIQYCVGAWATSYTGVLHELSGGLDSAIVLACLSGSTNAAGITCENYFTRSATGDERAFAQKAAKRAGVELIETPLRSSGRRLESMLNSTKFATPTLTRLVPEVESIREQLVKARGIEAVFSGQGGDHFFQQVRTPLIAAEYAWHHGLRPELLKIIGDTSRFTRESIWSVMATAFTSGILRRHHDPYDQLKLPALVSDAARDAIRSVHIRHSWIESANHLPGSKLLQIFNIIDSQNFYRIPCHYADIVHPLISQPIIELCLQIPCYVLTYDGIDRALVREAFATLLPPEITRRTIKGATTSYASGLLVSNLPFIREYLLGGILMQRGVLDRGKTEASLTESSVIRETNRLLLPLLSAIKAEAWLRTWISDTQRLAA
jgi:asparagine synthase (glutamine-hydrolysing)